MSGSKWWVFCMALVQASVAACLGCSGRASDLSPVPARSRYDCLIIRNLTGKDDVVTSTGFPEYFTPDILEEERPGAPHAASREAQLLGTTVRVAVYDLDARRADAAAQAALARIAELSRKLNIFDPKSDVSRINREAFREAAPIDSDVDRLIRTSFEVSRLSAGAFDVTVGPLTSLWRKYRADGKLPPADEVKRARELVGREKVRLGESPSVYFAREGMSFDFGGIAKGFAAEEAAKVLVRRGVRSAIVTCGGELKLIGSRPGGEPFRVGIDDPRPGAPDSIRFVLLLRSVSVSTSGNYRQFTMIGGRRYSHIIDPRTGESIEALPSVTVVGPDGTMCDALATAVSVLGEAEGLKLIEAVNAGIETGN